jgi:hypothetical protein
MEEISYDDILKWDLPLVKSYFLRFKAKKLKDESFKERYTPVLEFWAKRKIKRDNLNISGGNLHFFEQEGDNVVKDLVTLRLELTLNN